jgi:hypothetical protein
MYSGLMSKGLGWRTCMSASYMIIMHGLEELRFVGQLHVFCACSVPQPQPVGRARPSIEQLKVLAML